MKDVWQTNRWYLLFQNGSKIFFDGMQLTSTMWLYTKNMAKMCFYSVLYVENNSTKTLWTKNICKRFITCYYMWHDRKWHNSMWHGSKWHDKMTHNISVLNIKYGPSQIFIKAQEQWGSPWGRSPGSTGVQHRCFQEQLGWSWVVSLGPKGSRMDVTRNNRDHHGWCHLVK